MELLAPAGNMLKLKTALAFGADAVYLGIPDFSLRVRINDFDLTSLQTGIAYAHQKKKKVYITINIFAHNQHLTKLNAYIKKLKELKVDALIVSDPGIIAVIKKSWPKATIHLSTQANCTNWQAAKFWQKQGVKRIILGREVTLTEIKEIHQKCPKLELEYFVHGAMCMAYSGRCFLSKYLTDRSANLGDCIQPCRWEYFIRPKDSEAEFVLGQEEHGSYLLNSKDLCLLPYLAELKKAGISSFKIEGRAKSVYYQGVVVGIYKKAMSIINQKNAASQKILKSLDKDLKTKIIHRGYTTGFLLRDKADQNLADSHYGNDWEFCGQVIKGRIKVHNSLKIGDQVELVCPGYEVIKKKIKKIIDCQTKKEVSEAHGGSNQELNIPDFINVPEFSVLRRKI
jgi:putative protease